MGTDRDEDDSLGTSLKVMLAAAFTLVTIVVFMLICHFCARRFRRSRQLSERLRHQPVYQVRIQVSPIDVEPRSPIGDRRGLDPSVIESLPKLWYRQTDQFGEGEAVECSVCLAAIGEDAAVRVLPSCKHIFHVDCVDTWFGSNTTCPICRTVVESTVRSEHGAVADSRE